ncbi:MAG: hypothetical protein PUG09_03350, partial [Prevotella sp.]|nr:hypothetical protein [Prevotella sp.]
MALPLAFAFVLTVCSGNDDDYQPTEPLQDGNDISRLPTGSARSLPPMTRQRCLILPFRTKTSGTITVPLSDATPGITADEQVTFADGDSTAILHVALPDTAKAGQSYAYTLTVSGENTDPYTLLSGGLSFTGTAVIAKNVIL